MHSSDLGRGGNGNSVIEEEKENSRDTMRSDVGRESVHGRKPLEPYTLTNGYSVRGNILRKKKIIKKDRFKLTDFNLKPMSLFEKARKPILGEVGRGGKHRNKEVKGPIKSKSINEISVIDRSIVNGEGRGRNSSLEGEDHFRGYEDEKGELSMNKINSLKSRPDKASRFEGGTLRTASHNLNASRSPGQKSKRRLDYILPVILGKQEIVAKQLDVSITDKSLSGNAYENVIRETRLNNKHYDYRLRNSSLLVNEEKTSPGKKNHQVHLNVSDNGRNKGMGFDLLRTDNSQVSKALKSPVIPKSVKKQENGKNFQIVEPFSLKSPDKKQYKNLKNPSQNIEETSKHKRSQQIEQQDKKKSIIHRKAGQFNIGQLLGNSISTILKGSPSKYNQHKEIEIKPMEILNQLDIIDREKREEFITSKKYLIRDIKKEMGEPEKDASKYFKEYFEDCYDILLNIQNHKVASTIELNSKKTKLKNKSIWVDSNKLDTPKPVLFLDLDDTLIFTQISSKQVSPDYFRVILESGNVAYVGQ